MQLRFRVPRHVSVAWKVLALLEALGVVAISGSWWLRREHSPPQPTSEPVLARGASDHAGHAPSAAADDRGPVSVAPERWGPLGVRVGEVRQHALDRTLRAVATVALDESRLTHVHTRFSGWIERLYVSTTGEHVRKGQVVATVFSRELWTAQNEMLALARSGRGLAAVEHASLLDGSRARLRVLGMSAGEIAALERSGRPRRTVAVTAPHQGAVIHRNVSVGAAVDPSTEIVTIADLSRVWVLAEIPEADVPHVKRGGRATLTFPATGGAPITSQVEFLYPTLTERTRTLRVRFSLENPSGALRSGMYGVAEIAVEAAPAIMIPRDAVVDTGRVQHVFVLGADGTFAPRRVELGARLADRVEIKSGLASGERIVESGVFLIDSESRLRASAGSAHAGHGG